MHRLYRITSVPATLLLAGLAACDSSGGSPTASGSNHLTLSFATASAGSAAQLAGAARLVVSAGSDQLVITRAQIVLAKLELNGSATTSCENETGDDRTRSVGDDNSSGSGGGGGHDGCEGLALTPMVIDLPVDSSVVTGLDVRIPAGTYRALEAKIHVVRSDDDGGAAFLAQHPELRGASVRIEGTFNGSPFTFVAQPEARLELTFDPPLVVGSSPAHVTVHADLARWFTDANGALIDPSTASVGGPNAQTVDDNIAHSFHAFEDENRDGNDDHGRDGDGHHGGGDGDIVTR
jgi:hypothetical protein